MKILTQAIQLLMTFFPSGLRIFILNLMGHEISRNAYIAPLSAVVASKIIMKDFAQIRPFSILKCGKNIEMGPYSEVSNFVIVNGEESLIVGLRSVIGVGSMVDVHANVELGEYSATGVKNVVMTHGLFWPVPWGYKTKVEPIKIGNLVWITSNVKILAGTVIEDEVIILPNTTLAGHVKKSSGYYGTSFEQKYIPVAFFKEKMNIQTHQELIRKIMAEFVAKRGGQLTESIDFDPLERGIISEISVQKENRPDFKVRFFCGLKDQNLDLETSENTFSYDFQKLTYVSKISPKDAKVLLKIMRSTYGMRSMEFKYSDLIKTFNLGISRDNPKYTLKV